MNTKLAAALAALCALSAPRPTGAQQQWVSSSSETYRLIDSRADEAACAIDATADGIVGVDDLLFLLAAYGTTDFSCDGGIISRRRHCPLHFCRTLPV